MLLAFAAYRLPDAALVDEVVQQTFIRAFEQLADFDPAKDFATWLRAICRFMILAALERPETADADDLLRLRSCMDQLQKTSRDLVKARYQDALPLGDIARKFKQSTSWVATTLFRVRDALRRCLEQQGAGA